MMDDLTPYPAYKPSGVEWLGEVPAHWNLRRLRASVEYCVNGVWGLDPDGHHDIVCVRVADFDRISLRVNMSRQTMRAVNLGERKRRLLKKGDLLLEKSGGGDLQPVGTVVLYDHEVPAVSSNFIGRMPVTRGYDPQYLAYLHSCLYAWRLNLRSIKQTTGIQNLDSESYLNELVAFPPLPEQTAIVRFLDHADRRIRRYIRAKQKLIALLEEQKQAIIHQAVTGQVDVRTGQPYPAYKPSGVEWLRDVPAHWSISRLKTLVSRIDQGVSPQAENHLAIGMAWGVLKAGCVNGGVFKETEHKRLMPEFKFDPMLSVSFGDVLISRASGSPRLVGSVGRVAVLRYRLILSDKTFRPIFTERVDPDFMVLAMNGRNYRQQVEQAISGAEGLANNLPLSSLRAFRFVVPSLEEQGAIVCCLRETTSELSAAATRSEAEIALLHEYRARLIADVVTGKMDVREAATSLPDMDPLAAEDSLDGTLETVAERNFDGFDATLGETGHRES